MRDRNDSFPYDPGYLAAVLLGERAWEELPAEFGVVTAHNPLGQRVSDEANAGAQEVLNQSVSEMGLEHFRVVGASPDLVHREDGLGIVVVDPGVVWGLARMFHQQAFFWVTDGWVFVCDDASGSGWRAGSLRERYRGSSVPKSG